MNIEILNGEHAGINFKSPRAAAQAFLTDYLMSLGEHGPKYALEIAINEGREGVMSELRSMYDFNDEQIAVISEAWDDNMLLPR